MLRMGSAGWHSCSGPQRWRLPELQVCKGCSHRQIESLLPLFPPPRDGLGVESEAGEARENFHNVSKGLDPERRGLWASSPLMPTLLCLDHKADVRNSCGLLRCAQLPRHSWILLQVLVEVEV